MSTNGSAPAVFIVPRPSTVIGPLFVGNAINCLLMGTLVVQVYIFYVNFPRERLRIRLLVYGLLFLDILQTIFGLHLAWTWMIAGWNNPALLEQPVLWPGATIPIMCGLVSGIVQLFYAWQIWSLSKTVIMRAIACLIVLVALCQSFSSIIASSLLLTSLTLENYLKLFPGFEVWLAGSFVADILISCSMIWTLYHAKTGTLWPQSHTLINRLIVNTIRTGSVTAVCAAVDLALFVGLSDGNYHLAPAYILGKLYSNSLMATLNARKFASRTSADPPDSVGVRASVSSHRGIRFARNRPTSTIGLSQLTTQELTSESEGTCIPEERSARVLDLTKSATPDKEDAAERKSGIDF
ncbi:hypothetical protein BV25DRAFT_1912664 [Artomyces pyxidatus]|uniref:Uncharacterized protein n=1 Tax=Artomyces pyxidatus TaxID=48021 RepID=A0ACB8TE06_9AGAM|nr:hypothetical protein BV25DRAFT_1912664 [Artomyces pyxidatus]